MKLLFIFGVFLVNFSVFSQISSNQISSIVSAIYKIEGGAKTKYPFGIKSINTNGNYEKARRICQNTVINNIKRFKLQNTYTNYFLFLADRYCPPSSDRQGNLNWRKNIQVILGQEFIEKFHKDLKYIDTKSKKP